MIIAIFFFNKCQTPEPQKLEDYQSDKNVGRALEEVIAGELGIREDSIPEEV